MRKRKRGGERRGGGGGGREEGEERRGEREIERGREREGGAYYTDNCTSTQTCTHTYNKIAAHLLQWHNTTLLAANIVQYCSVHLQCY